MSLVRLFVALSLTALAVAAFIVLWHSRAILLPDATALDVTPSCPRLALHIVYYGFVLSGADSSRSLALIKVQHSELLEFGLANASTTIHLELATANKTQASTARMAEIRDFVLATLPLSTITLTVMSFLDFCACISSLNTLANRSATWRCSISKNLKRKRKRVATCF